jgi:hypothetical protein
MDLQDQKNLFPDHEPPGKKKREEVPPKTIQEPMICKFEKKGENTTKIKGYKVDADLKFCQKKPLGYGL